MGLCHWAQEILTVKYQIPLVSSNISYTVQIMDIILRCWFKRSKRRNENIDIVETNFSIFAKEQNSV